MMNTFNNTLKAVLVGGVIAAFPMPQQALAQATLEEVTVTARKRDESLLDVPLAITAFTSDDIDKLAIKELPDIVQFSPGFHYAEHSVGRGGRFNRRLIFRGMNPRTDRQTRQGATVFIDGAPMLGAEIGDTSNYETIEVIKGPQSAYFGRSTFSGAINVVTKTPGNEWAGKVSAEAARFGTTDFGAQVEGPLIADKLAFRLSGNQFNTDGEYANAANPTQRLGAESTNDVSLSLFATPTDNFTAKLRLHAWTDKDGPTVGISINAFDNPDLFNCSPGGVANGAGNWICGEVPFVNPDQFVGVDATLTPELLSNYYNPTIAGIYGIDVPYGMGLERRAQEISLNLDYEFDNGMTLSFIGASHENEYASFADIDRRPTAGEQGMLFGFLGAPGSADSYQMTLTDLEDTSLELRLTSSQDQSIRWMVGVSRSEFDYKLVSYTKLNGGVPNPNQGVLTHDPESIGIFASADWDINDQFTLSAEARQQSDKVIEGTLGNTPLEETFDTFLPRVILNYKPFDNTSFYLTYAEGTNPGQFNAGLLNRNAAELAQIAAAGGGGIAVEEEELTNIEFGFKSRFWDDRAQISAAVYFSDWSNIVAPELITITNALMAVETIQVNSNGGQADLSGLELEGTVLLGENFTLEGTYALTKGDIKDFESPDALSLLGSRTIDGFGNTFSRFPENSGTLSGTYEGQLAGDYGWYVRTDVIFRGSTWMTNANVTETGAVTTVNLKLGVEKDNWRVEAFGDNIFDEEGYTNLQRLLDLSGQSGVGFAPQQIVAGLLPRATFGVRATFEF